MNKKTKDYKGIEYESEKAMCEAYNIGLSTYQSRIRRGWSVKDALLVKKDCVFDHLGNSYPTQKAMCEAYNIDQTTYQGRIKLGWSVEVALTSLKLQTVYKNFYILKSYYNDGLMIYKVKNLTTNDELMLTKEMMDNYNEK